MREKDDDDDLDGSMRKTRKMEQGDQCRSHLNFNCSLGSSQILFD